MPTHPKDYPRPWRDEDWLRKQYHKKELTQEEIAEEAGCSRSTIYRWLEKYGIERRSPAEYSALFDVGGGISKHMPEGGYDNTQIKDSRIRDKDWLREKYVSERKNMCEISRIIGCTRHAVKYWLEKFDIDPREWTPRTGEDSHAWKGGNVRYYGSDWCEQRRKARNRDNSTCQLCGVGKEETGREPDVHHIRPFREFDDHKEANKLENLVSLCKTCHGVWEGIPLRPHSD